MSSVYNPIAAAPPTGYTIPSDGDAKSAASVNVPLQALMDGVAYINGDKHPSIAIDYAQPMRINFVSAQFSVNSASIIQQATTGGQLSLELAIPQDATIQSVTLRVKGATGHGATLTGVTVPTATVKRLNLSNATTTTIAGPTNDPSTTNTAYEVIHDIIVNCSNELVSRGQPHNPAASGTQSRYFVEMTGEAGGSFIAGLLLYGVTVQFTMITRDPGAS